MRVSAWADTAAIEAARTWIRAEIAARPKLADIPDPATRGEHAARARHAALVLGGELAILNRALGLLDAGAPPAAAGKRKRDDDDDEGNN
jgi:hypothetical protein